ncbi:hypothetical protein [Arthrobacter sp. efr-133-TYG-118]|uniref:hypothetical protein n=1 Tax=Arthrobacter sp. efr-133-TYG-118 TaxID=3040279 RepID=UPI0025519F23|nr:hypothetical protein [Arthrobacter sp. efr-133-TYG-118]
MSRRTIFISGGAAIAIFVVGLLSWWVLAGARGTPTPPVATASATGSSASRTSSPVPTEVADAISSLPADPAEYVSTQSPVRAEYGQAFPPGTKTHVVENSWSTSGASQGLVQVEISKPNQADQTYAAMMVLEDGKWKVLATVPVTR